MRFNYAHFLLSIAITLASSTNWARAQSMPPQDFFSPPLQGKLVLSGTFGELRGNHFHSGVDFKTDGVIGKPVLAVADGYISRVKVSPYGFGRALYLRHPNGYTSVYAHLHRFSQELEDYIKRRQQELQSNEVDIYLKGGNFSFEKGDTIALSGNSGGSGAPHLHFEMRDTRTEKIINPLLFGFQVADNRAPELSDLNVYQYWNGELMAQQEYRILKGRDQQYHVAGNDVIEVSGSPGFGIQAIDRLDAAYNPNGVYRIELLIDNEPHYDFVMNSFSFSETRYINSHIDYSQYQCCDQKINRLYLQPGNKLSVYRLKERMKFPELPSDTVVDVCIRVSDFAGNRSTLDFKVRQEGAPGDEFGKLPDPLMPLFRYNESNEFSGEGLSLELPAGALYEDIFFEHNIKSSCNECLSPVHQVASHLIPVHRYYPLGISIEEFPEGKADKLCVVSLREGKVVDFEGGEYRNGRVWARTRQFGEFAVSIDTLPPVITKRDFTNGATVKDGNILKIGVTDDLSGLDDYTAWVGDTWVRLYYDAKKDQLLLRASDLPAEKGPLELKVKVRDKRNNTQTEIFNLNRA